MEIKNLTTTNFTNLTFLMQHFFYFRLLRQRVNNFRILTHVRGNNFRVDVVSE
jgi:hypothetical protein